jgi:hypothetical protein
MTDIMMKLVAIAAAFLGSMAAIILAAFLRYAIPTIIVYMTLKWMGVV